MCLFSLCLHTLFHRVMFLGTIKHKNNSVIHYGKFPNNDYYLFFCPSLILIHIIIGFSYLLLNVSTYHFSLLYLQINIKIYFVHIMQMVAMLDYLLPLPPMSNVSLWYAIKFLSIFRQVRRFLLVFWFLPPINII